MILFPPFPTRSRGSAHDARRGERLVLFHTPEAGPVEQLRRLVAESDLPNLWKPAPEDYAPIPALPLLASGKLDLARLKALAREAAARPQTGTA